ncbi:MAG: galactokinase [Candidatus Omnitrophota bacterium]|jgi:N-acetylgalactosamine kinase|nr:MAG: galactokinase [Candidatus Omnitrophota bacterium]
MSQNRKEIDFHSITGFAEEFTVRSPGRVNLLGEHTDYNGLPVLPMAIDFHATITGRSRPDRQVRVWADQFDHEMVEFSLDSTIPKHPQGHWINYVKAGMQGILDEQTDATNPLRGCDLVVAGNVPQGVGLSSSSALVVASALALLQANQISFDRIALAERMAAAEHYVGTRGGGMDQATCLLGKKGHLLNIDFFPLRVNPVRLPDSVTVVICDSLVRARKTENALQAYNLRAVECRFAAMLLKKYLEHHQRPSNFQRLGDLTGEPWHYTYTEIETLIREALADEYEYETICAELKTIEKINAILDDYSFNNTAEYGKMVFACGKRFRHIITDSIRVERSVELLEKKDVEAFGRLMNEGHASARDDFEISCPELNRLVESAQEFGALGSRLTGAGFGGCTVNLVYNRNVDGFMKKMDGAFYSQKKVRIEDVMFISEPANGAEIRSFP